MINAKEVYKIKLIAITDRIMYNGDEWANGTNIFKRGGGGKTWTNKKLVNKSFDEIIRDNPKTHGIDFCIEIFTFKLQECGSSAKKI